MRRAMGEARVQGIGKLRRAPPRSYKWRGPAAGSVAASRMRFPSAGDPAMSRRLVRLALAGAALVAPAAAAAQRPQPAPAAPAFALAPTASPVTVTRDVEYARTDTTVLRMDVFRPADGTAPLPTLVFFNRAQGREARGRDFYVAWARATASRGVVAVIPDLRDGREAADFALLVEHLLRQGRPLGVDTSAIAVYAASGNVSAALPALMDPARTSVKAAVIYYGAADVTRFRRDLPLLWVRAGLDRPPLNREITRLAALAATQNAPVTLLNHASGYHGFEARNPDAATRRVMEQTIEFVRQATTREFQAAQREGVQQATAAGAVLSGDWDTAIATYRTLLAARPDDHIMRLAYGEALLGAGRAAEACAELETLKGKGLGYRDLGLPAARACLQKGDPERAIAWLASIPARFLPAELQDDPSFAPLRDREDFKALFRSR
jgi:dienelactone hydrolase